jgi:hypothetical protein
MQTNLAMHKKQISRTSQNLATLSALYRLSLIKQSPFALLDPALALYPLSQNTA